MYYDKYKEERGDGDYICPKCNRGFWTLRKKQNSPVSKTHWVIHACVFCIDNNAAKGMGKSYLRNWKENKNTEALDSFGNNPLTLLERFRARIRYITEE